MGFNLENLLYYLLVLTGYLGKKYRVIRIPTDSTKINRPEYKICTHVLSEFMTNFLKVLQNVVQIFMLLLAPFASKLVNYLRQVFKHSEELRNRRHFSSMVTICRIQRLVPRKIDQFGRKGAKRSAKMWTTKFFQRRVFSKTFLLYMDKNVKKSGCRTKNYKDGLD